MAPQTSTKKRGRSPSTSVEEKRIGEPTKKGGSSSITPPTDPSNSTTLSRFQPITFGVELEFIFAFHENELRKVLANKDESDTEIVKDLPPNLHVQWTQSMLEEAQEYVTTQLGGKYPSWGLRRGHTPDSLNTATISQYLDEPLLIARKALGSAGLEAHVDDQNLGGDLVDPALDYSKWSLIFDGTLVGKTDAEKIDELADRINEGNVKSWDSFGVEAVSRVLSYADPVAAFHEIGRYVSALKDGGGSVPAVPGSLAGPPQWGIMKSTLAGAHVHIGFNVTRPSDIDVKVLQHLAYILISHEDLITQFHPRIRSGCEVDYANRYLYHNTQPPAPNEYTYYGFDEVKSNAVEGIVRMTPFSHSDPSTITPYYDGRNGFLRWTHLRDAIFASQQQTVREFASLMHGRREYRGFMVNWSNLARYVREPYTFSKCTIEFRQHACCVDEVELKHWVDLLFAMILKARERAGQETRFGGGPLRDATSYAEREASKYLKREEFRRMGVDDLCGPALLDLGPEEVAYWKVRFARFRWTEAAAEDEDVLKVLGSRDLRSGIEDVVDEVEMREAERLVEEAKVRRQERREAEDEGEGEGDD